MKNLAYVACALSLALVACRGGGGDDGGDDMQNPDAPPIGGDVTIQQIQDDAMPIFTQVELRGVVVTAIDAYGARTGDIWVGEPGGGEFSGIKVFKAPLATVATLAVGDIVDITNIEKDEFALMDDDSGRKVTEVKPVGDGEMVITRVGPGTLPTPATVDAKAIAALGDEAARDAEWEKWEGVRIKVINARQLGPVDTFGAGADDQKAFDITGGAVVETVLAPFHADAVQGTCFSGITGVGDYFFDYLLLPDAESSTAGGGSGCEALPVAQAATIQEVQAGTKTGLVEFTDVYVTALNFNRKQLWVSQSLTAAANQGVYVYRGSNSSATELPVDVVVGAKVKVVGTVVEFANGTGDTLTEITFPTITVTAAPTAQVTPASGQTAASLVAAGTGEPYEGVLVTLTNVKVTKLGATGTTGPGAYGVGEMSQGGTTFRTDDDMFLVNAAVDTCIGSITGIWTYNAYDDVYLFLPSSNGTGTGTCN